MSSHPLLLIGLDAAEQSLICDWIAAGKLPHLAKFYGQGAWTTLNSTASEYPGSAWSTMYTGCYPQDHGLYHYIQWHPGEMRSQRVTSDWLSVTPFWRDLAARGLEVLVLDVPFTLPASDSEATELSGWAAHDMLAPPFAFGADAERAVAKYGATIQRDEQHALFSIKDWWSLRADLMAQTEKAAEMFSETLGRAPWDLALVCFGATHRAGHKLWDVSNLKEAVSEAQAAEMRGALLSVYEAIDAGVGALLEQLRMQANVMIFSTHGMGPNSNRSELLPEMLSRVLGESGGDPPPLSGLRSLVPNGWRDQIKRKLPRAWQDQLTSYWRQGNSDWSKKRAFCLLSDLQGFIRINLVGRENAGIVQPGAEYDALCRQIIEGLHTFVDAESGESIVSDVLCAQEFTPPGERQHLLPDLIVRWMPTPATHRAITSSKYGTIASPTPGKNIDSRSGNHRDLGFLMAQLHDGQLNLGGEMPAHIVDIAPTVYELLGVTPPATFRGSSLLAHDR